MDQKLSYHDNDLSDINVYKLIISVSKSHKFCFALLIFSCNKLCTFTVGKIMLMEHMSYMLDGPLIS
jgi:hypothetical protein